MHASAVLLQISAKVATPLLASAGHQKEVVELCTCSGRPGLLASLSKDGNLRLWDVPSDTCLASIQTDATCLVCPFGVNT